jgi:hypothetical protein
LRDFSGNLYLEARIALREVLNERKQSAHETGR